MTEAVRVKILRIVTRMSHAQVVFFLLTQLNNFHSDPYVCEDWKETEFCSDKCDDNSTKLVTRACFPIQDPLPEEVEPPVLIKPGNSRCNSYSYCRGDNNLNSNQIKKQSHRRNDKMDRLVRVQGQLQPEQGFWIQGKKSNSGRERKGYCWTSDSWLSTLLSDWWVS